MPSSQRHRSHPLGEPSTLLTAGGCPAAAHRSLTGSGPLDTAQPVHSSGICEVPCLLKH